MTDTVITTILALLGVSAGAPIALLARRTSAAQRKLAQATDQIDTLQRQFEATQSQLLSSRQQMKTVQATLAEQLHKLEEENKQKEGWLDHMQEENDCLRAELAKRPKVARKTYKILTLAHLGGKVFALRVPETGARALPAVDAVLGTMMAKRPEMRYGDVAECKRELAAALAIEGVAG